LSDVDKYIVSKLSSLIVCDYSNFEIADHMPNINNAVFASYNIPSFLSYSTHNTDIFLLIFQPSEFLSIYTIVFTRGLTCFKPRFSVLSLFSYNNRKSDVFRFPESSFVSIFEVIDLINDNPLCRNFLALCAAFSSSPSMTALNISCCKDVFKFADDGRNRYK